MKKIIDFLIKVSKLKEMPRTGWVLMKVKDPETISEHVFRMAFLAWLLGEKKNLSIKRIIEIALVHDLCEVYAGDITPFFYWEKLDFDKKEDRKVLLSGIRLSQREKEKRGKIKFEQEKKALLKLIAPLESSLAKKICLNWLDFTKAVSRPGKFVKQVDRIETLTQSIEYFGPKEVIGGTSWWEGTEEIVEDPLLLDFLKVIQKKFYGKVVGRYKRNKELENILEFILKIGKLKQIPRLYWRANEIKNPETVASHVFSVALMAWLLGKEKKQLNMEKILKMALCHELSAVYTGDTIPYIRKLPKDAKKRKEVLKKWPRLPEREKRKRFAREYKEEKEALLKLTFGLEKDLKKEIINLWDEYRMTKSPEAKFLSQVNSLALLLQGLLYQKKYLSYFADPLWEWAFEKCDDPIALEFLDALKEKFY